MAGKIFYRERSKIREGARAPRYRIIAVSDVNLKVYGNHLRDKEIKKIAEECGAKLIELKAGRNKKKDKEAKKK